MSENSKDNENSSIVRPDFLDVHLNNIENEEMRAALAAQERANPISKLKDSINQKSETAKRIRGLIGGPQEC